MTLDIVGAGFGRTGTLSMHATLEQLGFQRCYHMMEVSKTPSHAEQWHGAAKGEAVDWDALLAGYRATVDWPACYFWRELSARYPNAKVLLTVRPAERWYRSMASTIYISMNRPPPADDPATQVRRAMARELILERTFGGRFEDEAYAISVYEAHIAEVRREVPAERLIVYETGSGWEPLCAGLGVPVPDTPFPHVNTTAEFRAKYEFD